MAFTTLRRILRSPNPKHEITEKEGAMPPAADLDAPTSSPDHPASLPKTTAAPGAPEEPAVSAGEEKKQDVEVEEEEEPAEVLREKNGVVEMANGTLPPPEEVRELATVCGELDEKVARFLEEDVEDELLRGVKDKVRESMAIIAEALERYTPEELSLSYNGGKDCLVLLILLLATLNRHTLKPPASPSAPPRAFPSTVQCIYIVPPHPFPEVDAFVAHSSNSYSLTLTRSPLPMRAALSSYLASNPKLRAVFVGTRRTDPHGSRLSSFDETDGDWPRFMRVHPVLEWHYAEIWAFIRHVGIEYCGLYDLGYTSLGGTTDTLPNPALRGGEGGFRPAYELISDGEERLGRD
ncbi:related to FAD1 - flavin adenine dinucleotide (FAD) synthetase [Cephalotrichum gorgonifer]|uniref:FAD synthase n=1 Tax=Cephalotrichum gorgonifer TaxID=2041049 RepID=A0AAE8MR15_9PEZI|nr:related to FAD1 - flavin adenine dinucleotide (FAD) synthetase [Cephalotrichum gorgonifer]